MVHKYLCLKSRLFWLQVLVRHRVIQGQKKTKPVSIGLRSNDECYSERPAIRRATPMGLLAPCPMASAGLLISGFVLSCSIITLSQGHHKGKSFFIFNDIYAYACKAIDTQSELLYSASHGGHDTRAYDTQAHDIQGHDIQGCYTQGYDTWGHVEWLHYSRLNTRP